jgi:rhodanese-related sulfurtransferase
MADSLIDVREYPEYAAGHIQGAKLIPLGTLGEASAAWTKGERLTIVCKSGRRAEEARKQLVARGFTDLAILPGGMDAWRKAGKPIQAAEHRPWAMERQVRTAAGVLILATLALGVFTSRFFFIGTVLVGAGLTYAGISDTCMMASGLARMPWNRPGNERG